MLPKLLGRRLTAAACLCLLCISPSASAGAEHAPVRIGISEFAEYSVNLPIIPATVAQLEKTLGKENVDVKTYSVANLQAAAKAGRLDIILSSAGTYRRLAIEGAGVRDLATVVSERAPNPNYADGSVFFVLKERADIRSIGDLRHRTVAANHRYGFSGWQTAMGELLRRGFPEDGFFGAVLFKGHDMPQVVEAVESGEADAGIVRACFLEDMGADLTKYRILDPRPSDGKINCVHSTDLYPNWTVSTLPSTPPEVSRRIAAALLSMPPGVNGLHWSVGTDFRSIDRLFLDLKIGPYEYLRKFSFARFVREYSLPFAVVLTFVLALILHSVTVSWLVRRRTAELEDALRREKALEAESRTARERFAAIQKAGIVGQMSGIIAHELRQPLASISMYSFGLLRRLENGTDERATTVNYLEKISEQTKRASDIVDQVRAYAKGNRERSAQNLAKLISAAAEEARKSLRLPSSVIRLTLPDEDLTAEANPLEIELIAVNLIRNAADAVADVVSPSISVTLTGSGDECRLTVSDIGPPVSDELFAAIVQQSARTTKEKGLGLGLSIIRSLTEDMGGHVVFSRSEGGGLAVAVILRRLRPEDFS